MNETNENETEENKEAEKSLISESISIEDLNSKIDALVNRGADRENQLKEYLNEVKMKKTEDGKSFIYLPENFDNFVDTAFEEQKVQDALKERGFDTE